MPRIDPLSLLKCLSVLLGSTGGIKSKEEVHRLANLMTKFSKKLVSKCIYIQILKTTDTDLLSQFMGAGGWNLVHMWLTDGILAKNWALIQELLELLLLCPVDIERLKSNNCPKLIKGLSKEGSHQGVRILASRLVEQWLKIVKGEAAPNSVPAQIVTLSSSIKPSPIPTAIVHSRPSSVISTTAFSVSQITCSSNSSNVTEKNETDRNSQFAQSNCLVAEDAQENKQAESSNESHHRISEKTLQLPVDVNNKIIQQQPQSQQQKKQSFVVVPSSQALGVPVYKITIRDGKQVLTKVETDSTNINNVINIPNSEINGDLTNDTLEFQNIRDTKISDKPYQKVENQSDKSESKTKEDLPVSELLSNQNASEITTVVSSKDNCETDSVDNKIKDNKDNKQPAISSENNKSANDKENRDFSKKDNDKKNSSSSSSNSNSGSGNSSITSTVTIPGEKTTSEKKSSHHSSSSSSKSSSKHSSSHRSSSNSHRSSSSSSSSHRSNSKNTTSKDKTKDKHHSSSSSSSSSKHSSNSKTRSERDKEKEREKEKQKKDQAEKDKATLEKVQGPALTSKLGKIPKKKTDDEKPNDITVKRSSTDSKEAKDKETKKSLPVSTEKKNISMSIENRKIQDSTRPKTVKTFNSKFRSTGLEEEAKPPPPRSVRKPNIVTDKQKILSSKVSSLKRSSPLRESSSSADKKARLLLENSVTPPNDEKKGGIKLIPPKPKPMILQESDMFMDALTAASTKNKEPRKRKRRTSISKDSKEGPDTKKVDTNNSSENNREHSPPLISPSATSTASQKNDDKPLLKPNFKFYQDTLEIDDDKEETKGKGKSDGINSKAKTENGEEEAEEERDDDDDDEDDEEDEDEEHKISKSSKEGNQDEEEDDEERSTTPTPAEDSFSDKAIESNQEATESVENEIRYVGGLRSVLIIQKRKGPKKSLKWKVDLESIRYFELDETERVNVTKTFTDMKQIEKQNEREAFQMARKLSNEDLMEEKTRWRALIPIDVPPALVEPGKDSREKDIQYAREKGILQALYFHRNMIPDTPAEPEEERLLPVVEAKVIPLDDLTGTKANEKDFTGTPWPEPKPQLSNPQTPPVAMTNFPYQAYPQNNQHPMLPSMGPPQQTPMGPMPPMPQSMINPMNQMGGEMIGVPVPPGGGWRTGDGKVVVPDMSGMNPMSNVPGSGYPQGMEGPMVPPPPGMMGPPMYNQPDGFMLGPDDMGYNNVPNNFQGPPGPVMYGPGPGPGPNFQGGPRGTGPGPMHVNRGRGGPPGAGWFRGGPPVRGVGWRGGWRGNAKQPPVCRQFSKSGYCRAENKCQFLHPGVNCPPF